MTFVEHDGGRAAAGYKGAAGDCGCRALSIAAEMDYQDAYDLLNRYAKAERARAKRKRSSARNGYHMDTYKKVMADLGWEWVPTMQIGSGTQVHMRESELPAGRIIVRLSKHYAAVVDGVLHDTYDCSRGGARAVYGYWVQRA